VIQRRLVLCPLGADALHARMRFDQGVLNHLRTDRPLRARSTIEAGPHDRDRQRWMGACNACVPMSQSAWEQYLLQYIKTM
jgi:hypothetical protein